MKLELYYSPTSPYSRKVRVMLLEKGVPLGLIDIRKGERQAKEANPLGKVPTLLVDGTPLFDSVVITSFIEEAFETPALLPRTPFERALVRRFEALGDGISDVLIPIIVDRKRPADLQNTALHQAYIGKARASLELLEQSCSGNTYLHGDVFSLADIAVVAGLGYVNLRFPELLEGYDELNRYSQRLLERPSLAETIPPNLPPL
jgi:glutathione S-transferase